MEKRKQRQEKGGKILACEHKKKLPKNEKEGWKRNIKQKCNRKKKLKRKKEKKKHTLVS